MKEQVVKLRLSAPAELVQSELALSAPASRLPLAAAAVAAERKLEVELLPTVAAVAAVELLLEVQPGDQSLPCQRPLSLDARSAPCPAVMRPLRDNSR